jgi:hypothetical protein
MRCSTDSFPLSAILCKLDYEQEQRDTSALGKSKNYSPWLLCYHVTKHSSLHGLIFNTKSNTGSFREPSCTILNIPYKSSKIVLNGLN